jgi:hypothetical protein
LGGAVRLIVCMYVHDEWEDGRIGSNMAKLSRIESLDYLFYSHSRTSHRSSRGECCVPRTMALRASIAWRGMYVYLPTTPRAVYVCNLPPCIHTHYTCVSFHHQSAPNHTIPSQTKHSPPHLIPRLDAPSDPPSDIPTPTRAQTLILQPHRSYTRAPSI